VDRAAAPIDEKYWLVVLREAVCLGHGGELSWKQCCDVVIDYE